MQTWERLAHNPELFATYFIKEYFIHAIRAFFIARNYHELESPILTPTLPQERYLEVLQTEFELKDKPSKTAYLIPSTETFNKKILAAGLGEHFVITKVFRGLEDIGPNHSPEFTMLEWYHLNASYQDLMNDCEELFTFARKYMVQQFRKQQELGTFPIPDSLIARLESGIIDYQGQQIDMNGPWERISVPEALEKFAGLKLEDIQTVEQMQAAAAAKGYKVDPSDDWQTLFELIFANEIESQFNPNKPTFMYDFPRILCPLTKVKESNPLVCEKVELYVAGKEIANGYTELRDWQEQERRFREEQAARKAMGRKAIKYDSQLVAALRSGLPPVAGIGMGIDRLIMIMADAKFISDINYFPAIEMFADDADTD